VSETRALPEDEFEEVDALPVIAEPRVSDLRAEPARGRALARPTTHVVAQAAAVAVTSFAAGAVVHAVAKRARAGKVAARPRRELSRGFEVVSTRTYLVDVHLLGARTK